MTSKKELKELKKECDRLRGDIDMLIQADMNLEEKFYMFVDHLGYKIERNYEPTLDYKVTKLKEKK